jgi:hypothetical protein
MAGNQSAYLLLIGDPGLGEHNAGNLFNLAAQQAANDLNAQGHKVTACRVSSIQNVHDAMVGHGLIDGGVQFYTHGGPFDVFEQAAFHAASILAVGQGTGQDTNVSGVNVSQLADVRQANNGGSILGPQASITIFGCRAGESLKDYYLGYVTSIAQQIANMTQRGVYAWKVGMYFSDHDTAHDTKYGPKASDIVPEQLPVYMVPLGPAGKKPGPTAFTALQ